MNGVLTGYGYDEGQLIAEEQGSTVTAVYTWGNGLIRRNGEYPLTDGRGNVRRVTDGSGNYLASTQADEFGVAVSGAGSTGDPYLWGAASGYRSDGDGPLDVSPLTKVGARYYDAQFGVFLTRDTELDQKPYAYCDGDPVNATDPSGHHPILYAVLAVVAIGCFIYFVIIPMAKALAGLRRRQIGGAGAL